jgi:hypothetical protein
MAGAIRAEIRVGWPFGVLLLSMLFGVAWSGDLIGHDTAQRDAEYAGRGIWEGSYVEPWLFRVCIRKRRAAG